MTTPIELLNPWPITQTAFGVNVFQGIGSSYGGAGQTSEYADPIWRALYTTKPMMEAEGGAFQAFLHKLSGVANTVLAYDVRRPVPIAYKGASGSPWGTPEITTWSRSAGTINTVGWAAGAVLTAGDYISFQDTNGVYYLYQLTENVTANGSGQATLNIYPKLPRYLNLALNTLLTVRKACCTMVLQWDPLELPETVGEGRTFTLYGHQVTGIMV